MSEGWKQEVKCNIRSPVDRGLRYGDEFKEARNPKTKNL
jgi:hypothetical protein